MEINKVELDPKVETFIESEQEKYETSNGITSLEVLIWQKEKLCFY